MLFTGPEHVDKGARSRKRMERWKSRSRVRSTVCGVRAACGRFSLRRRALLWGLKSSIGSASSHDGAESEVVAGLHGYRAVWNCPP